MQEGRISVCVCVCVCVCIRNSKDHTQVDQATFGGDSPVFFLNLQRVTFLEPKVQRNGKHSSESSGAWRYAR